VKQLTKNLTPSARWNVMLCGESRIASRSPQSRTGCVVVSILSLEKKGRESKKVVRTLLNADPLIPFPPAYGCYPTKHLSMSGRIKKSGTMFSICHKIEERCYVIMIYCRFEDSHMASGNPARPPVIDRVSGLSYVLRNFMCVECAELNMPAACVIT